MKRLILVMSLGLAVLAGCSTNEQQQLDPRPEASLRVGRVPLSNEFNLPPPDSDQIVDRRILWATNYYTPIYRSSVEGIPLIDENDEPISGGLSQEAWCDVALQGTAAIIDDQEEAKAYVYMDSLGPKQTDCRDYLGSLSDNIVRATEKARFKVVSHRFGCGVEQMPLFPYRTIAVDKEHIAYRTTIYVPSAQGLTFDHPEFGPLEHDGYFFAGDRGGAIRDNHIDVFTGNQRSNPFATFIFSNPDRTFEAYLVDPNALTAKLLAEQHRMICR